MITRIEPEIVQPVNSRLWWGEVPPEPDKSAPLGFMKTTRNWPPSSAHNRANASDFSGSGGTSPHRKHERPRFGRIELNVV